MRSRQALALAGAGLMALGAVGPWAQTWSGVAVGGMERGGVLVLLAAGLVVLLQPFGGRGTPLVGALTAAWIALGMYTTPGSLVQQGASEAEVAGGAFLAMLGALLVVATAASSPRSSHGPARRAVLPVVCLMIAGGVATAGWTSPRADTSWVLHARDDFSVESGDGRARAVASVEWHHGSFPAGLVHRGGFTSDSVVEAVRPVGCLWARAEWGFALGVAGMYDGGYMTHCRRAGAREPAPISLAGLGYAKTLLNSATLTLCVSDAKSDGPGACATHKVTYSPV